MINEKLKNLMIPYIKMDLPKQYYNMIDVLLEEAYYYKTKEGINTVAIRSPIVTYMCFLYSTLNGAFVDMESWEYVIQHGKKI